MKGKLLISIFFILLITLNSCKKEDENPNQSSPPLITINDPSESYYNVGDTVHINVLVTDEREMHDAEWFLILSPQNDTLWNQRIHSHATEIIFNTYFIIGPTSDQQNVNFIVKAENAFSDETSKTHNFIVNNP